MAIKTDTFDNPAPPAYVKKADRTPTPPGSPIRVSDLGLADKLYAYVKSQRKNWTPRNAYASSILDDRRMQVFKMLGIPETDVIGGDNPEWAVVADLGTALHDLLEKWTHGLGIIAKDETTGKPMTEYRVKSEDGCLSGRVDAVLELDGEHYILDYKTVNRKNYDEGSYGKQFTKYIAQLNIYGRILGIQKGVILLACRDSARLQEFVIDLDFAEADKLLLRAKALVDCAQKRRIPTAETSGWDMAFNSYKTLSLLEDQTGWVQRALNEGHDPARLTVSYLTELFSGEGE